MKHFINIVFSFGFILLLTSVSLNAQHHQGYYMKLDFLDIDRHEISDFKAELENILKPVSEARIQEGALHYWYVYKVLYPGSRNTTYNYVIVSIYDSNAAFENAASYIADQLADTETGPLVSQYNTIMMPEFSELWRINNSVLRTDESKPSRYFMLDYMRVRPGMEYTYQMMEDENAKPIHEYRMENGNMEGWELFSLILPRGDEYGYNFATGNYFSNLKDVEFHFNEEVIRQTSPDVNVAEFFDNVENTRTLVRSEVLELVDYLK